MPTARGPQTALLAAVLALCGAGTGCEPRGPDRIALLVVDTLRRDFLSCYGSENPTPAIDALAARGQALDALASYHQTTMSMGALFTGLTPAREAEGRRQPFPLIGNAACGMVRMGRGREACVPDSLETLAESLRAAGYATLGVTSNPLLFDPSGFSQGFDTWVEVSDAKDTIAGRAADRVLAATGRVLDERETDRFFLYVHFMDVHDYAAPAGDPYDAAVRRVDRAVGELVQRLRREGLLEGTQIVLTSDHGERLFEEHVVEGRPKHEGNPSFEPLLRVPLVVAPPLLPDPERVVRGQDLPGLIAGLAGRDLGADSPLAEDELYLGEGLWHTYRSGRWKAFLHRKDGRLVLVDLERDPGESHDVSAEHPEVAAAHAQRIDELARALAADADAVPYYDAEDLRRLKALGYVGEAGTPREAETPRQRRRATRRTPAPEAPR